MFWPRAKSVRLLVKKRDKLDLTDETDCWEIFETVRVFRTFHDLRCSDWAEILQAPTKYHSLQLSFFDPKPIRPLTHRYKFGQNVS